jgi:hypothetical protein
MKNRLNGEMGVKTEHISVNSFLFIKNKQLFISSEGFSALEKNAVMFSEDNAAHPVGCDNPLQIVMAVWHTFLKFELAGSGMTARCR